MRTTAVRRDRALPDAGSTPPDRRPTQRSAGYAALIGLALIALAALAAIFLFPYVTQNYRYPSGWDAPTAVLRARTVADSGIARFGAIRAGAPLLLTVMGAATGRNAHTMVALVPAVLMWVTALGVVALVRVCFDVRPIWLPVLAFLAWSAFGENGMLNLHLDNLLNIAMVLPAFAAAAAFVRWRRGAVAVALLLAVAAVAHWPFFAFGVAIFLTGLVLFVAVSWRAGPKAFAESKRSAITLAIATAASAVVAGATFLQRGRSGWVGARLVELREQLRQRFFGSLRRASTYYPFPTAILGALTVSNQAPAGQVPRRFFLSLMVAWTLATVLGGVAQAAGLPTAGARELHYFFPLSIFTGLLVWWVVRRLASRPGALRVVAAAAVLLAVIGTTTALAVSMRSDDKPWFDRTAVEEITVASQHAIHLGGDRPLVFIFEPNANKDRPTWLVVRSTLPQDQLAHSYPYYGTVDDYLSGVGVRPNGAPQPVPAAALAGGNGDPLVFALQRYAPTGFKSVSAAEPDRQISHGVVLLRGELPSSPLPKVKPPIGDTRASHLTLSGLAIALLLLVAGGGWAWALLPTDSMVRVCLAPALGAAASILTALAWAWVRLPLRGAWGAVPLILAGVAGWLAALLLARSRGRALSP